VIFLTHHIYFGFEYLVVSSIFSGVLVFFGSLLCKLLFRFRRSDSYGSTYTYLILFEPLWWWTQTWYKYVGFLGWKVNFSCFHSTLMLIISFLSLMSALMDFRKEALRMIDVYWRGSISTTRKFTKVDEPVPLWTHLKDRIRRLEEDEWDLIKILHQNLTYIPQQN
jgi:hypothetical protein